MTDGQQELQDYVGDRSSVLLLAPQLSTPDNEACIDLLTGQEPGGANVLSVTVSETPDERLALWRREVGERLPKRATVVDAGSQATVESQAAASEEFPSLSVDALPADAQLVDVGISIARHLSGWGSNPEPTFLCLHSVSTLLDSFDRERVLSLVRGLNDLCDCLDVVAHHHMDPRAHSEETTETFRPHYEMVVEHLPDHGWMITDDDGTVETSPLRRSTVSSGETRERTFDRSAIAPVPYSLDTVLDILSVARRRALLYYLRDRDGDATISLDHLVEGVEARENAAPNPQLSTSADQVRLSLVHVHLPKLDEAGIVVHDADAGVVKYKENPALESCLDYVEMLEFG